MKIVIGAQKPFWLIKDKILESIGYQRDDWMDDDRSYRVDPKLVKLVEEDVKGSILIHSNIFNFVCVRVVEIPDGTDDWRIFDNEWYGEILCYASEGRICLVPFELDSEADFMESLDRIDDYLTDSHFVWSPFNGGHYNEEVKKIAQNELGWITLWEAWRKHQLEDGNK